MLSSFEQIKRSFFLRANPKLGMYAVAYVMRITFVHLSNLQAPHTTIRRAIPLRESFQEIKKVQGMDHLPHLLRASCFRNSSFLF